MDRQLQVIAPEAENVRHIFRRYAELGKVDVLRRDLAGQGITGKQPVDLTANRLANTPEIPVDWAAQRNLILGADG